MESHHRNPIAIFNILPLIMSVLCIAAGLTDYFATFLFVPFTMLYLILTYLIATKPSNNVCATNSLPLYFTHLGYDITIIVSTILFIILIIILIKPFDILNKRSTITVSIITLIFTLLTTISSIKNSNNYRKMNRVTKATVSNNNKMKAILIKHFGQIDDIIEMVTDQPKPILLNDDKNKLLIKVLSVSLSPSDYRMWSGATSMIKYPKYGFHYCPLGDVCGIVMSVSKDIENKFKIGDYIVATWDMFIHCMEMIIDKINTTV